MNQLPLTTCQCLNIPFWNSRTGPSCAWRIVPLSVCKSKNINASATQRLVQRVCVPSFVCRSQGASHSTSPPHFTPLLFFLVCMQYLVCASPFPVRRLPVPFVVCKCQRSSFSLPAASVVALSALRVSFFSASYLASYAFFIIFFLNEIGDTVLDLAFFLVPCRVPIQHRTQRKCKCWHGGVQPANNLMTQFGGLGQTLFVPNA